MSKGLVKAFLAVLILFTVIFLSASIAKAVGVTQKIMPVAGGMSHSMDKYEWV
jgi:hypothetical protein